MTEHLSVDQSVSLGGAAVTIIFPSPDQTQPATEDSGLEKFIAPAAAWSFFLEIGHRFKEIIGVLLFFTSSFFNILFIFETQTELFIYLWKFAAHIIVVVVVIFIISF